MNADPRRENHCCSPELLVPDIRRSYRAGRPVEAGAPALHRLVADTDVTRDARTVVLKKHIRNAMALACEFQLIDSDFDASKVDPVDASANLLYEAIAALRSEIGAGATADALKAIAACMAGANLSEDVLNIVDNVRYGYRPC